MQLQTLDVNEQQAREALIHYRRARKLARNAEDKQIIRGYRQVMKGRTLIELPKVIAADPALLKHIGGDLWAVVAVWNLTDLEMAVLAGGCKTECAPRGV